MPDTETGAPPVVVDLLVEIVAVARFVASRPRDQLDERIHVVAWEQQTFAREILTESLDQLGHAGI